MAIEMTGSAAGQSPAAAGMAQMEASLHPLGDVAQALRERRVAVAVRAGYLQLACNVVVLVLALFLAFSRVFLLAVVTGTGMYPAVVDGDVVLGYRLDREFRKNDVVVCRANGGQHVMRVVARAGDSVNITEDGALFVNGTEQVGEIAFPTYPGKGSFPYTVPQDSVYVLGDHRTSTTDSRDFGPVPVRDVQAKVVSVFRQRGI